MGGVIAELLRGGGLDVTLVAPDGIVSSWCRLTEEQRRIQARLLAMGVRIEVSTALESVRDDSAVLACAFTGETREVAAGCVVMVTSRAPSDALYHALSERIEIARVGDCSAPGTIASAVYAGHRYARELDCELADVPFLREGSMR
jgi:dimethylamine/trimethylamine dehydrogenase